MKLASVAFAAAISVTASLWPDQADAQPIPPFGFGYYGPGVSVRVHPHPGYYYGGPHYHPRPYRRHRRVYRRHAYPGACQRWHHECVASWGYRNSDYYGCMRYHGCR